MLSFFQRRERAKGALLLLFKESDGKKNEPSFPSLNFHVSSFFPPQKKTPKKKGGYSARLARGAQGRLVPKTAARTRVRRTASVAGRSAFVRTRYWSFRDQRPRARNVRIMVEALSQRDLPCRVLGVVSRALSGTRTTQLIGANERYKCRKTHEQPKFQ